jgi:hypothetical protein
MEKLSKNSHLRVNEIDGQALLWLAREHIIVTGSKNQFCFQKEKTAFLYHTNQKHS